MKTRKTKMMTRKRMQVMRKRKVMQKKRRMRKEVKMGAGVRGIKCLRMQWKMLMMKGIRWMKMKMRH